MMITTGRQAEESRFDFGPQDYAPLLALRFAGELPATAMRLTAQSARRLLCGDYDDDQRVSPATATPTTTTGRG